MNAPTNIKSALEALGYELSDSGAYWQANAAYRGGDSPTSLQIYKDSGVWIDYVERTSFSPFDELVRLSLSTNDSAEVSNFIKTHHISLSAGSPSLVGLSPTDIRDDEKIFPESCLDGLSKDYSIYNEKGISNKTLINFQCGLISKGDMADRFVFPIFNKSGKIHGLSGRDITGRKKAKWKHLGSKTKWCYPYYTNPRSDFFPTQEAINRANSVILVESIGDMLSLHERGYKNVLVTFGLSISPSLICLLSSLNIDRIIISLNNDSKSGENRGHDASIVNFFRLLYYFDYENITICLPCNNKNDFGEMDSTDFSDWAKRLDHLCENQEEQIKYILKYFDENLKRKLKNRKSVIAKYQELKDFFE
ncbi:MAG: hypothetical protein CME70_24475 [Halobacteriovorax sp.]|nr:hypothetical protein [Halobacteriovorax sp.]|tara:strand:- start:3607 stop:4698 length:1092 start_codon:yes stop_codon:yes gene_type:complete